MNNNVDNLPLKEIKAIELRYLGNMAQEIAQKIDVPVPTVEGWFKSGGKLIKAYNEYTQRMNDKRKKDIEDKISVSDDEFFIIGTNIVRSIGKSLQKRKILLVDKKGRAVADKEGNPQYVETEPESNFGTSDLMRVWEMQRMMQGKPTKYEKQDITQTNFDNDMIIKELGLTKEDFENDKLESTRKRITEYLLRR